MTLQTAGSIPKITTDFNEVTFVKPTKKKRLAPLSIRLSPEQRARLEDDAAGMSLNAYVLSRLFDGDGSKNSSKRRVPTNRDKAIARALRRLAHSGMASYLVSQITAQEEGRLMLSGQEEASLREAYAECYRIRRDLVEALGLEADYSL